MSLRGLIALSKKLKARRHASGALNLASSEIRFDIDNETKNPISVQEKMHLDTNSMVGGKCIFINRIPIQLILWSVF